MCGSFESPSIFGAILDTQRGGCFHVGAVANETGSQQYIQDTNVLVTSFETDDVPGERPHYSG